MIITLNFRETLPKDFIEINCTSRGTDEWKLLSPFIKRPISTIDGLTAMNLENLWQFSKVYPSHVDNNGNILDSFYLWREKGFNDSFAHRYPMGKGAIPLFTLWGTERLGYIEARKKVYFQKYAEYIKNTSVYKKLNDLYLSGANIAIRDFDVYRFDLLGMTINEVINNPDKKAGHGFVLYKMLTIKK